MSELESWFWYLSGLACLPQAVATYILAFRAGTRWHIWLLVVAATLLLCTFTWFSHYFGHALAGGDDVPSWWFPHFLVAIWVSGMVCVFLLDKERLATRRQRRSRR
jgi:hypothetical protein